MTDERAAKLAELLAEYIRASKKEGAQLEEVGRWTIAELASDLEQTHPDYLPELPLEVRQLAELA